MKKILGLDLGTTSIGWAYVNEAENKEEKSSIVRLGVRVIPLTTDEQSNFEKGKPITTNADRTLKRSMRRNLQRYKLRRDNLRQLLKEQGWITDNTILSENGNNTTFETYRLRAKAATESITLEQLARVLLMINKKRGYKSSRKAKGTDEGQLIDGMDVARKLYDEGLTPGQYADQILREGKHYVPDFYRSDLEAELDKIWAVQQQYYPDILTAEFRRQIENQGKKGITSRFLSTYKIFTADIKGRGLERLKTVYALRAKALKEQLPIEEMAFVVSEVAGAMNGSSGYLGAISDRSKELYFAHQTIGQYLIAKLDADPHGTLKNQPFYRQDYLDEFEQIWETQAKFHPELTPELKHEIRDIIIFYQRRLKSQKWLVSNCEFEKRKVCPKSSPLFQAFRIWQVLNNLTVNGIPLEEDQKTILWNELQYKQKLSKTEVLKLLFVKPRGLELNYKEIQGNRTMASLLTACQTIIDMSGHGEYDFSKMSADEIRNTLIPIFNGLGWNTDWLDIDTDKTGSELDQEPQYRLWHLLYSFEGDDSPTGDEHLVEHISNLTCMPKEYAKVLSGITFEPDYGSLSTKAIQKILPFMKAGHEYSEACALAGYRHSKSSLTKEEIESRELKEHMTLLSKNCLRNPVVEKILNQMVNVVNEIIDTYGRPDEVRIEMARELKKNAAERADMTTAINKNTKEVEECRKFLQEKFGAQYGSRNDIIRYRLYKELAPRGYKTLYSNQYIPLEKLFSKEIDIEHIIPQARLFDDSFSNKTLEYRDVNIEKGATTAYDYVKEKYGEEGLKEYLQRVDDLFKSNAIGKAKQNKLKMSYEQIPDDFIERDLRNTQYIARKAQEMLFEITRSVVPTTGSITDRLRNDWQLVDVMKELNWNKYEQLGLTEISTGRDGQQLRHIKDWTKRNDHRHHAMDALTIAFTKRSIIQYLNNMNARSDKSSSIYGIEKKETNNTDGHIKFNSPMPIAEFRAEAKRHLEMILVSNKAKNKVVTKNININKVKNSTHRKEQLTPRGQLHLESVCGELKVPELKEVTVNAKMDAALISQIKNPNYRQALRMRLEAFGYDPKKAFTGKNSLDKNPIWLDEAHTKQVPTKVTIERFTIQYVIRKKVDSNLNIDKVVDERIKDILKARLDEYDGNANKAFSNLEDNPIWLNREKGIQIKSVRCKLLNNAVPLHDQRDKDGHLILNAEGKKKPQDFVNPGNNHHVAIFMDANGSLQEHLVTFYEATSRALQHLPIVDREYNKDEGWQFLFSMKQNEYFVFPNKETGFDPNEIDLLDERNYDRISPNLYRVQKISNKDYVFRHHLETTVDDKKELKGITWKRVNPKALEGVIKVRVNHIGKIVQVGEY
ncbi:MAG: type II CRISPR RNA-guided endonuclease Cas9 [Bacteroidales bacterium]|nr:type II CRISPR RNA-guided endonuclease Cas9 [Bacteroidales bacterium]